MFGFGAPGGAELIVLMFIALISVMVTVLPMWLICSKAGFPGWISIAMLIPFLAVILLFFLAFADWPALRGGRRDDVTSGGL